MYTWGYMKENALNKLGLSEAEANQQNFLSRFPYYANEAMTQICSIKPRESFLVLKITKDRLNTPIGMPEDFIAFSDDVIRCMVTDKDWYGAGDEDVDYYGYNEIIFKQIGTYHIPYKARWFFFTKDVHNATQIPAPADICDAIPSYIVSQCFKIDDEVKSAIYRNEFEMFLARLDDTSFKSQRTLSIGGGW